MARNKKANAKWRVEARRTRAFTRQEERSRRNNIEQIKLLNERLGKGVGAQKERDRLSRAPLPHKSIKECADIVKK